MSFVATRRLYATCHRRILEKSEAAARDAAALRRMAELEETLVGQLLATGKWRTRLQFPNEYKPQLTARPWHEPAEWPGLEVLKTLLESHANGMAQEYRQLRTDSRLLKDQDCIGGAEGSWSRFEITGVHNSPDADGCSTHTPVTCGMLRQAWKTSPVAILRAGFSALEPGTWIKPHYGMTNTKLKLHLGLIVPQGTVTCSAGCQ